MTTDKPTAEELADTLDVLRKSISDVAYWPVSIAQIEKAADTLRSQSVSIRERDAEIERLKSARDRLISELAAVREQLETARSSAATCLPMTGEQLWTYIAEKSGNGVTACWSLASAGS